MLRFTESFEMNDWDFQLKKWTGRQPDSGDFYNPTGGRFGGGGWVGIWMGRYFWKTFSAGWDEWVVGFAVRFDSVGSTNSNLKIAALRDTPASPQIELRANGDKLTVTRNGTLLGTGTTTLVPSIWYFVELKVLIHNSAGEVEVHLDGNTEISLSGIDTQATANASADTLFMLDDTAFGYNISLDDIYVLDGDDSGVAGAPNNDFLGDVRVQAIFPNGNGNSSDLVGSDGNSTDNYLLVDETNPDEDTTYVESATVGDEDTYAMTNLTPAIGTVFGLVLYPYARKTDAGVREIAAVTRSAGVEEDGPSRTLSATYQYFIDPRDGDPSGNQWTIASVNAMESGVKVTA